MKKRNLIIIAIVAIAVLVVGFTLIGKSSNNKPKYRLETVARGDIEMMVTATGTLNPVILVDVGSQVSGKIEKIYVDFNSKVKQGDILAELDQSQIEAQIEQNQANYQSSVASVERSRVSLEIAQKNYERALSLYEKNLIASQEKDTAEASYLQAKADLTSAEARASQAKYQLDASKVNLGYTIIKSPIDGVVVARNINVGQTVAASFQAPVLFQIANDLAKMQVECLVDEADVGSVKEGQKVKFTVEAYPNDVFWGTVRQVRYAALVQSNVVSYTAVLDVDNSSLKLLPGMTATCSIIVEEAKNILRVPNTALRFTPSLKQEELQKLMKAAFEEMAATRQQSGQGRPAAGGSQGQMGQRTGTGTGTGLGMPGASGQQAQRRTPPKVWALDEKGNLKVIFVRTGMTDTNYTEVVGGGLKEGDEVIVGLLTASSTTQQGQRPGGPMFRF